ncbi:IS110 family transposase [Pseudomonas silesiensis]|uniref:Transposase n=1 Tax=Pseudomonas silesiensis TaxID=1853130 RepID=A0A191YVF0_9PSED|nr:IS110 family transposase [Pseudomonas silesiensis]ANJ56855.1 transposase [Pseudomonas silesiensis]VVP62136.1 IS110 family transposase ISCps4 [Pseudomonas fluorescens]
MQTLLSQKFTAYVGIDWADIKHDVCLQVAGETRRHFSVIDHTPQSIDRWAKSLFERYGAPIAIALELNKGPLVAALQKYEFFCLFPINPSTLAKHRKTFIGSGAKDDPTDAQWALELLLTYPLRFPQLMPQSPAMRVLASLTEHRRALVNERVRMGNRLICTLKQYYPLALELFSDHDTVMFCDFLMCWPTLDHIQRSRQSAFLKFFNEHNARRSQLNQARWEIISKAIPLTQDPGVIRPSQLYATALASQLKGLLAIIKDFDREIEETANTLADYPIFKALPGAGQHLAPRLMVAFGEQRDRFNDASAMQRYAGIAPVTQRSGKKKLVYWRYQCSTFLRQTFVEWAAHSITQSTWAEAYYRQQRAKGCSYQATLRGLAFKWIRIVYRCWKTSTVYDEKAYLQALIRRGSTLIEIPMEEASG